MRRRPRVTSTCHTCRVHVSRPRVTGVASTCHTCRVHVSQVSSELEEWALATYGLDRAELSLAACGLKLTSGAPRQA